MFPLKRKYMLIKQQINENFENSLGNVTEYNIELFLKQIKNAGGITKEQNEILLKNYINKKNNGWQIEDIIERTILIMANDALIWYVVNKYFGYNEDLYSVAKMGMIKAVDYFSFDRECSFPSFATRVMINEILMCKRVEKKSIETLGGILSLDSSVEDADGDEVVRYAFFASDDDFVGEIAEQDYCRYIEKLFVYLTPIEQKVMIYTYGLFENEPLNQVQVAQKIGVTQSYVSRMTTQAREKVKALLSYENKIEDEKYKKLTSKTYPLFKN